MPSKIILKRLNVWRVFSESKRNKRPKTKFLRWKILNEAKHRLYSCVRNREFYFNIYNLQLTVTMNFCFTLHIFLMALEFFRFDFIFDFRFSIYVEKWKNFLIQIEYKDIKTKCVHCAFANKKKKMRLRQSNKNRENIAYAKLIGNSLSWSFARNSYLANLLDIFLFVFSFFFLSFAYINVKVTIIKFT